MGCPPFGGQCDALRHFVPHSADKLMRRVRMSPSRGTKGEANCSAIPYAIALAASARATYEAL